MLLDDNIIVRDGHFRIPNLEGTESQTIRNPNRNINRIIGNGFKLTQLRW